jgi:hypothetical protein
MMENKNQLAKFVQEDRFELDSYLTYLFNQITIFDSPRLKDHKAKRSCKRAKA